MGKRPQQAAAGWLAVGLMTVAMGGCDAPKPATRPTEPLVVAPPPPPKRVIDPKVDAWRPDWWLAKPEKADGMLSICAMASDKDLLVARRRAIEAATGSFVDEAGRAPTGAEIKADSLRLDDGVFRAFVRLTAKSLP